MKGKDMTAKLHVINKNQSETEISSEPLDIKVDDEFIEKYAKGKEINEVVKAICNSIARYAGMKDFSKAERLREKLIAIAPMSIDEIVKSAEIIEKEKICAMDYEKIKPWAELFNKFSPSEAAAFYFALNDISVKERQRIFQQGECDNRLFFIESGSFKLTYYNNQIKKSVIFSHLRRGDICGSEVFFTHSPHTTTLTALEDANIRCLEKQTYQKLLAENPSIESKLIRFCENYQKQFALSNPQKPARRAHPRFPVSLTGQVQRIDDKGNLLQQTMQMTVSDISAGGLSYIVQDMGIGDAANLHQSRMQVTISYQKYSVMYDVTKIAKVVAVRFLPFGECSVHLQFLTPMDEAKVFEIAEFTNVPAYL